MALLTTHWRAVEGLASALVAEGRIEGARIARITGLEPTPINRRAVSGR
jgi:hypothetical protein